MFCSFYRKKHKQFWENETINKSHLLGYAVQYKNNNTDGPRI